MKSKINISEISHKLRLVVVIIGTLLTLQGCMFSIGGDNSEEPAGICEGISEGIDQGVSRSACIASGRDYIEERGCYCGPT